MREGLSFVSNKLDRRWITLVPGRVHIIHGIERVNTGNIIQATKDYDQECLAFLNASDGHGQPVHLIDDLRGVRNVPPVTTIYNMQFWRHPSLGCYVTLGVIAHPVLRFVATRVSGLVRLRYTDAVKLNDAYQFLLEKDPTLPAIDTWDIPEDMREA
jgi:hypothetical protein